MYSFHALETPFASHQVINMMFCAVKADIHSHSQEMLLSSYGTDEIMSHYPHGWVEESGVTAGLRLAFRAYKVLAEGPSPGRKATGTLTHPAPRNESSVDKLAKLQLDRVGLSTSVPTESGPTHAFQWWFERLVLWGQIQIQVLHSVHGADGSRLYKHVQSTILFLRLDHGGTTPLHRGRVYQQIFGTLVPQAMIRWARCPESSDYILRETCWYMWDYWTYWWRLLLQLLQLSSTIFNFFNYPTVIRSHLSSNADKWG